MIVRDDVLTLMLEACPSFADTWDPAEHVDGDGRLLYLEAADFCRQVFAKLVAGDTAAVTGAFACIERLHVEGDDEVRTLGTVGFLEVLQTLAEHDGRDADALVRPHLGPLSRQWWDRLGRFWDGDPGALRE